ncbi:diguanylate cyclase (GGDEF)-like protein [Litorivivens lipolytica]|uniref:Diguanylate cyclase (GGDEF)-like protein n=2 Tax=Litorivivens lipolytica TaxID=1524264 RepID=A0A7W4W7Q2_9GAMM|nr:GGDEF domain-containing protein [Litorivivens lipolytica]MBB3048387.1 diguanylate cyclase (GGDEF)-like protein [Litorivivens lipolytica]
MYSYHLLMGFAVVMLWLFRARFSQKARFWMVIALMWLIGTLGVVSLGMMGAGTWWLASSALVGGMSMSLRVGMGLGCAAIVFLLCVAAAFSQGLLTVSLELDTYMAAYSTWATYILVAAWLPMVIFSAFVKHADIVTQLAEETARAQLALQEVANTDMLTGAVRPHVLEQQLRAALSTRDENKKSIGVIFIDLDQFKPINDTYGHAAGDAVLKAVVERSRTVLRSGDVIARAGGDEFVVVIPGVSLDSEAELVARKLRKAITRPFTFDGHELEIRLSMGVVIGAKEKVDCAGLMKIADELMYKAKRSGTNNLVCQKLDRTFAA